MSSNYPCLPMENNVVEYNETQKSNLSDLLNMHCLDSEQSIIGSKTWHPGILLVISFSLLVCSEVWWWSWYLRQSPLWPWWLVRQHKIKQGIARWYLVLHDNTAEGRYGKALAWCTLSSVFQTDFSNWSIFQVINVAWDPVWRAREMKRSSGASLPLHSLFKI